MRTITQLSFDFTPPIHRLTMARERVSWRVQALAQRHGLPMSQAAVYAAEMCLPAGRVR